MSTFPLSPVSALPTSCDIAVLDTEGTGLRIMDDTPFMLLAILDGVRYAVEWCPDLARWCGDVLPRVGVCAFHNAKFDLHMFIQGGVNRRAVFDMPIFCTQVGEALLDEHRFSYALDDLGKDHFGIPKANDALKEWILANVPGTNNTKGSPGYWMGHLIHAPREMVAYYGIGDVDITDRLHERQKKMIADEDLTYIMNLEMETLKALMEMERRGVRVDIPRIEEVRLEFEAMQRSYQQQIIDVVGFEVNSRSPNQMTQAFNDLGIPIVYNPPTAKMKAAGRKQGGPCFNKEVLASIDHPFTNLLTKSRGVKTMLDTFIGGNLAQNRRGYIHTCFNQTRTPEGKGTGTGRLSSSGPNLQQIPKRDGELAHLVRSLFIPEDGHDWISNDWEQFEFRVFAHFCRDQALIDQYNADPTTDFHTAASEMTGQPRPKAKQINLGLVFGMGEGLLAKECGLPYTFEDGRNGQRYMVAGPEAKALFAEYHHKFPKAGQFLNQAANIARQRGYVKTLRGRRLRFPGGKATHKAGGLVFQGSSADVMKEKVVELNNEFRNTDVIFHLPVHDEFNASAPKEISEQTRNRIKEITEEVLGLRVPILADAGIGKNWWEAC